MKRAKQIPLALKGFAYFLKQSKKSYQFIIIGGDYWFDPEIDKTIQQLGLKNNVEILSHVAEGDLPSYYHYADAFLSLGSYEGFCIPALEAMASGCPVVGARSGAMPEMIGNTGICVDPHSPTHIAKALENIIKDTKLRSFCIRNGKRKSKSYTWEHFGTHVLSIIQSI